MFVANRALSRHSRGLRKQRSILSRRQAKDAKRWSEEASCAEGNFFA
jgi:hypothetical protein